MPEDQAYSVECGQSISAFEAALGLKDREPLSWQDEQPDAE